MGNIYVEIGSILFKAYLWQKNVIWQLVSTIVFQILLILFPVLLQSLIAICAWLFLHVVYF